MLPIRTILHATDFSPRSDYAFRLACALAQDYGAKLVVAHVIEQTDVVYGGVMTPPPPPEQTAEERKTLKIKLEKIRPENGKVPVEHILTQGDPGTVIAELAEKHKCDLVIIGTHGRTGLDRLLMGSVAETVLRKAKCPVLTVKVPLTESTRFSPA